MEMRTIASRVAKREGKKSQARIGEIREILSILVEMETEFLRDAVLGGDAKKQAEGSPLGHMILRATQKARTKQSAFKK